MIRHESMISLPAVVAPKCSLRLSAIATRGKPRAKISAFGLEKMSEASVERTLGQILGSMQSIEKRLDQADTSRRLVYEKIDKAVMRLTYVETEVQRIKARVDKMQTVHDDVVALSQKAQGAGVLGHWLIKLGFWVVAGAGWFLSAYSWLSTLIKPPPP